MATSIAMSFNPSRIIDKYTPERLSDVSGIPRRTLYRWRQKGKVAGKGVAQKWRIDQLKAAAEKLKASEAPQQASAA